MSNITQKPQLKQRQKTKNLKCVKLQSSLAPKLQQLTCEDANTLDCSKASPPPSKGCDPQQQEVTTSLQVFNHSIATQCVFYSQGDFPRIFGGYSALLCLCIFLFSFLSQVLPLCCPFSSLKAARVGRKGQVSKGFLIAENLLTR